MRTKLVRRLAVLLGVVGLLGAGSAATPAFGDEPELPAYQITTSPSDLSQIREGDTVRVTISGLPAFATANAVRECPDPLPPAAVADDPSSEADRMAACTDVPIPVFGAVTKPIDGLNRGATTGLIQFDWRVGRGKADPPGHDSYTCDDTHACSIAINVVTFTDTGDFGPVWTDTSLVIRPRAASDQVPAGCKPPGSDAVLAAMPERMLPVEFAWERARCTKNGAPLDTFTAGVDEGTAMEQFDSGNRDLAFTGATVADAKPKRNRVYVPVATNALVLAAGGLQSNENDDYGSPLISPFTTTVRMTQKELATAITDKFARGVQQGQDGSTPFLDRNPVIANMVLGARSTSAVYALTGPDAGPALMSQYLAADDPGDWVYGDTSSAGKDLSGKPIGEIKDWNSVSPGEIPAVTLFTSRVGIAKAVSFLDTGSCFAGCVHYMLTDLGTALSLGYQPVALQNSAGEFVEPTADSISRGVAEMVRGDDGLMHPNPHAQDPKAYPLPMIDYAVAPAEPLLDEKCKARPAVQQTLTDYLKFAVTDGQQVLPPGVQPLPQNLAGEAADRLKGIGASAISGKCAPAHSSGPGANGSLGGDGPASLTDVPGVDNALAPGGLPAHTKLPTKESVAEAKRVADATSISAPGFAGAVALSLALCALALVLVLALTSGSAYAGAARPAPPWLQRSIAWTTQQVRRMGGRR